MPKDPTKNIFQYKIRGGHLNEFEFQKNQGEVTEQHDRPWETQNFDPNARNPEQAVNKGNQGKETAKKSSKPVARGAVRKSAVKPTKHAAKKKASKVTVKKSAKKAGSKKAGARKPSGTGRSKKTTRKATKK